MCSIRSGDTGFFRNIIHQVMDMQDISTGKNTCPELFLRVIHVKSSQTTAEGLDLFPLSAASAVSRLVIGYRRDRYLSHYAERFISIAQEPLGK